MKQEIKKSTIYLILALVSGVFFREFTKFNQFTQNTALGKHIFIYLF